MNKTKYMGVVNKTKCMGMSGEQDQVHGSEW